MSHFDWKLLRRKKVLQLQHTVPEHTFRVLLFRTLDPSHAPSPLLDLSTRGKISHGGGFSRARISAPRDPPSADSSLAPLFLPDDSGNLFVNVRSVDGSATTSLFQGD